MDRIFLLIFGLLVIKVSAQDNIITFRVTDNLTKKPVKGAAIYVRDSLISTTNYIGYSQVRAIPGDTLIISCTDYLNKFIIVPTAQKFQVGIDKEEVKLDFNGGIQVFYKQLGASLKHPSKARSKNIQNDVYVEFKVDSTGQSIVINIHNDTNNIFGQDINRVFKNLNGKWSAEYSNKTFLLSIKYRLESLPPPSINYNIDIHPDRQLSEMVVTAFRM